MKFFDNLKYRLQQWSYGRYGFDELSRLLYILGLVILPLSLIDHLEFIPLVSLVIFIYIMFRSFSRNKAKRKRENDWYLRRTAPIRQRRESRRRIRQERKVYDIFKCGKCGNLNRVPRGKGKIRVTCPKCGSQTIRRT